VRSLTAARSVPAVLSCILSMVTSTELPPEDECRGALA
jgi:hypothetical protein